MNADNIFNDPIFLQTRKICKLMYQKGWNERNGGNISVILGDNYNLPSSEQYALKENKLSIPMKLLANKYILITCAGKYLKNVYDEPQENLAIIRISPRGDSYRIVWGKPENKPTSEIITHLLAHQIRLKKDKEHSVIIHNHATNIEAMTFLEKLEDKNFSNILWKMQTESIIAFPEGVGVLPWMICGNEEIGIATAEKMKSYKLVIWAHHGILGAGRNLDETFGLIETAEKAAEIYIKIYNKRVKQILTNSQLKELALAFKLNFNEEFLK